MFVNKKGGRGVLFQNGSALLSGYMPAWRPPAQITPAADFMAFRLYEQSRNLLDRYIPPSKPQNYVDQEAFLLDIDQQIFVPRPGYFRPEFWFLPIQYNLS